MLTVLRLDRFGHHFKLSVDNHKVLYLLLGKHTVRRAGQPVECAGTYVLLASDDASYITGQVYGVTGGTQID